MNEFSKLSLNGNEYIVKDEQARNNIDSLKLKNKFQDKPLKYGKLSLPSDFAIPFNLYRGLDGKITDDLDLSKYDSNNIIYVNRDTGYDGNATGLVDKPFKTIRAALDHIKTLEGDTYKIICQTYRFFRNDFYFETKTNATYVMNKNIIIEPEDPTKQIIVSTDQADLTWTQQDSGVWLANRSSVYKVYDMSKKDGFGMFKELTKAESLSECIATRNSYYLENTSVYLNTKDGSIPTTDTYLIPLGLYVGGMSIENNTFLRLKNIDFYLANVLHFTNASSNFENTFICENVKTFGTGTQNGFDIDNIKNVYLLECVTGYNYMDGFNYHYYDMSVNDIKKCFIYERNCVSFENGLNYDENNCNCSTTHEGVMCLRVNGIYQNSKGPVIADVNSPYSILINCKISQDYNELATAFLNNVDDVSGKVIFIDCECLQVQDLSLTGDDGFNIELKNFKGNYINDSLNISEYMEVLHE